jgi:hypothetical protein
MIVTTAKNSSHFIMTAIVSTLEKKGYNFRFKNIIYTYKSVS